MFLAAILFALACDRLQLAQKTPARPILSPFQGYAIPHVLPRAAPGAAIIRRFAATHTCHPLVWKTSSCDKYSSGVEEQNPFSTPSSRRDYCGQPFRWSRIAQRQNAAAPATPYPSRMSLAPRASISISPVEALKSATSWNPCAAAWLSSTMTTTAGWTFSW